MCVETTHTQKDADMTIKVHQFNLTKAEVNLVNDKGWDASAKTKAYMAKSFGKIEAETWFHAYEHVATVASDNLAEAFALMNRWDQPERVEKHADAYSMSVGDILELRGEFYLVARTGFAQFTPAEAA